MSRLEQLETLLARVQRRRLESRDEAAASSGLLSEPVSEVGDTHISELREEHSELEAGRSGGSPAEPREVQVQSEKLEAQEVSTPPSEAGGRIESTISPADETALPVEGVLQGGDRASQEVLPAERAVPLQLVGRQAPALFVDVLDLALSLRVREES